jgi:hypothetical protein
MRYGLGIKIKALALIVAMFLIGCGNDISRLSDDDLRKEIYACDYAVSQTPSDALICGNYHRECKRRLKDEGRFVCN